MDPMKGILRGFDIATAGMRAEMARAQIVAANISNANQTGRPEPYRRKSLVFEEVLQSVDGRSHQTLDELGTGKTQPGGVRVGRVYEDHVTPFVPKFDPGHPDADERGFVLMPNIDLMRELVDLSVVERSYRANLAAMNTYRGMIRKTVEHMSRV